MAPSITTLSRSISTIRRIVNLTLIAKAFLRVRLCCSLDARVVIQNVSCTFLYGGRIVCFKCKIQKHNLFDANM